MAAALAAGALLCGWAAPAGAMGASPPVIQRSPSTVLIAVLPPETTLDDLARIRGISLGVMSSGIGSVPAEQTYLDISQGNRINDALYDAAPPQLRSFGVRVPHWAQITQRADGAPADLVPGSLASSLLSGGVRSEAVPAAGSASLVAAQRGGLIGRENGGAVSVIPAGIGVVRKLAQGLPADGLVIAFAEPDGQEIVPIGVAGTGFDGDLTSDSTRTGGYVLSTDLAPTILRRFGLSIPDEMNGEPIRAEGSVDPDAVVDLAARMKVIPDRRAPLLIACLASWILLALAVNRIVFGLRRVAIAWLALAFAYMPLMLLAGAALEPPAVTEGLLVGFGAVALAALTVRFAWGWRGLAIACAITVIAYGIEVIAGSDLTRLSLLGPNPIFGVRFYGIGNELEALLAVMVPVTVGAGLTAYAGRGRVVSRDVAVAAFLVAAVVTAIVFGAGRFGADVGAAIVLPVGAAVAAVSLPRSFEGFAPSRPHNASKLSAGRLAAAVIGAPLIALFFLAVIDLASGGNAHLTRSALDAGGAGDLADVAERRLRLSAHDFGQAAEDPLFWIVVVGIALALSRWRRIDSWLRAAPIARAGVLGACAAVAVGVLVNDSGASYLVLGALAVGAAVAFAWSQASTQIRSSPRNWGARSG